MPSPPKCSACGHVPHPAGTCNVKPCDCTGPMAGKSKAQQTPAAFGAIGPHSTDTGTGSWDGPANEARLPSEAGPLRASHAWVDTQGDAAVKSSYRFIHHDVSADGSVGAANLTACSTGIGVLNGGRGGTTIPPGDKNGVYNHLAKHLTDGGRTPPEKNFDGDGNTHSGNPNTEPAAGRAVTAAKAVPEDVLPEADATGTPYRRWRMPVAVLEGVTTGDGRRIAPEALTWRDLPQSLMANTQTTTGHDGAELVGRIDAARRYDAADMTDARTGKPYGKGVYAIELSGVFTTETAAGRVADLIKGRFLRGVSVDLSDVEYVIEYIDENGNPTGEEEADPLERLFGGDNMVETVTAGRLMGCTVTPFPAFEGAYIELLDDEGNAGPSTQPGRPTVSEQRAGLRITSEFNSRECEPCAQGRPLVAGGGPQFPPATWFADPELEAPTPLTVLDTGRVFGHLATWDSCHTGYSGQCVTPPRSATDYALFRTGAVKTAEGTVVAVGQITVDTGHADLYAARHAVLRHYDNTGSAVADVAVGEDEYGPWIAGALRPDLSEGQIRTLRASALSGDWREWGGALELLAILAVNVPGFPVVRELVAAGMPRALVAAGSGSLRHRPSLSAELAELRSYLPELILLRRERMTRARARMAETRRAAARVRLANVGQ